MPTFKKEKLRVNLRLAVHRLKLLEKKKTEQALKARKEIADYLKNHRYERARVRVEHIIREDYLVEALEVVELYCDLLVARFGLLEQKDYCDDTLAEPVATLVWVTPRLSTDIQELKEITYQLENKYGKAFTSQARSNLAGTVNPKVIHRLGVEPISQSLVEKYMIEIARNYKVEYEPDPSALLEDDIPPPMEKPFMPPEDEVKPVTQFPSAPPSASSQQATPDYGGYTSYPVGPPPPATPTQQPQQSTPPSNLPYPTGPMPGQQPPPLPNMGQQDPPQPMSGQQPPNMAGQQDLHLPPVPSTSLPENSASSDGGGDVDFDDLTRRFEQLKKKK